MSRIALISEHDASARLVAMFTEIRESRSNRQNATVDRAMSPRSDFLQVVWQASQLHFHDGALSRTQHDMIAAQVAALTHNDHCLRSYTRRLEGEGRWRICVALGETGEDAALLRRQGERYVAIAGALRAGRLDSSCLTDAERKLLEFIGVLTVSPSEITNEWIDDLRSVGWSDDQIAEAVYDGAQFNMILGIVESLGIRPLVALAADDVPRWRETW